MAQVTNTTKGESLSLPKKGGGHVDIRPGETVTADLDMEHAAVKGAMDRTIVVGKPAHETPSAANPKARTKPE